MARLSIEQIRAPDLSVASQATARAGESFQRGMTSASALLGQYQSGIEENGDAQIFQEIAQISNEEELNAYLSSAELANRPMSASMRNNILNRRDNVLAYGQARATTDGTIASTANTRNNTRINTNADNRTQADWNWQDGARREDVALGNLAVASQNEGRLNGNISANSGLANENVSGLTGVGGQGQGSSTGLLEGFEGLRTTPYNDPATDSEGNQVGPDIYRSGYGSSTYTTEDGVVHDVTQEFGGTEEDARRDLNRRNEQEYNPKIRDAIGEAAFNNLSGIQLEVVQSLLHNYGSSAFSGTLSGVRDAIVSGDSSAVSAAINALQGQNGGVNDGRRRIEANAFSSGSRQAVTQNPNGQGGPAATALIDAVSGSNFTPSANQIAFVDRNYNAAVTGQNAINAADQVKAAEFRAQQQLDILDDPDVINSTEAIVASSQAPEGATAAETLNNRLMLAAGVSEGGPLASLLAVGTSADPEVTAIAQTIIEERASSVQRDPVLRAAAGAISFESDPSGSLVTAMEGLGISVIPSEIEGEINKMAREMGITPAEAAYSFARAAEINLAWVPDWTIGGDNLSQNRASDLASQWFVGDGAQEARQTLRDNESLDRDVVTLQNSVQTALRRVQKSANTNDGTPNASYVRAYETAAQALDQAVQDSIGTGGGNTEQPPAPVPLTFQPPGTAGMLPFNNGVPGDGSNIQAYLDGLNN